MLRTLQRLLLFCLISAVARGQGPALPSPPGFGVLEPPPAAPAPARVVARPVPPAIDPCRSVFDGVAKASAALAAYEKKVDAEQPYASWGPAGRTLFEAREALYRARAAESRGDCDTAADELVLLLDAVTCARALTGVEPSVLPGLPDLLKRARDWMGTRGWSGAGR